MRPPRYELLAPAGDEECLRAAVANGADAVYFGLEDFNARRRAANFSLARLGETMDWLHRRNVQGYVAFNTLVFQDELPRAAEFVRGIIEAGADAIIVQDLGIAVLTRRLSKTFPIHASTQTTQTHPEGMHLLAGIGVNRVILARELSLGEIAQTAASSAMELEAFVHGALCVSYSGQCLASESLWGRSGNRGLCGQACRLPYQLIVDGREHASAEGDHLLSPHDLGAYERIPELMRAGVTSFKIEGRLKSAQYVACVVRVYREAIDAALRGEPYRLTPERQEELDQSFSRGLTCGFLDGTHHQELVGPRSPKSRGTRIGTVVQRTGRGIVVALEAERGNPAKPGDGVVFDAGQSEGEEQGGRIYSVERWHGQPAARPPRSGKGTADLLVELTFGRGDVDLRRVEAGSVVFKTDDPAVGRRIEASWSRDVVARPVPVQARVVARVGEPMLLVLSDGEGHSGECRSEQPLAAAERHPLTIELLTEQLSRLGDTPFKLESVELVGADGPVDSVPAMAPKSVLNHLRRNAAHSLLSVRLRSFRHTVDEPGALAAMRSERVSRTEPDDAARANVVHVLVRDLAQLQAMGRLTDAGIRTGTAIGTVYADLPAAEACLDAVRVARELRLRIGLASPRVIHPGQEGLLDAIARAAPDVVLVRNLTALGVLRRSLPAAEFVGDFSLNVANGLAAAALASLGLSRITVSYDLNLAQVSALCAEAGEIPLELTVHAHLPLFLAAFCPAAASLSKGDDCRSCGRPCERRDLALRDRNGEDHPLRVDAAGRSTIFSSTVQSIAAVRGQTVRTPVRHLRVELLDEPAEKALALVSLYASLARGDETALGDLRKTITRARAGTLEHA